jgi:hypothetical protein
MVPTDSGLPRVFFSHRLGAGMRFLVLLVALPLSSCTTTPGSRAYDMSASQHETVAEQEEQTAAEHADQYDPKVGFTQTQCRTGVRTTIRNEADLCWTSVVNPTDAHRLAAEEHRRHAADHRAGSAALRKAEAHACAGIAPADRDMSPFEHADDIESVAPLKLSEHEAPHRMPHELVVGAVVVFREVPGMTREWLQRVIVCHLARNASLGHDVPEMPNCPLVPKGATAAVSSTGSGFAVAIESSDPATAKDILARAQRLIARNPIER